MLCGECIDASPKGIDPCQRRLAWTEISQFSVCPSNGLPPDSVVYYTGWTLWICDYVLNCLVFCIMEMHWAPFCLSMFRIHFWSGFGPIWRDESCNDFFPGLSVSCLRDVNVTLTLRKQLNITAGILSQDHT